MLTVSHLHTAIGTLFKQAESVLTQFEYRLVGTAASVLHGIDLPAGDIDILVKDRAAVDAFHAALSSFPCSVVPRHEADSNQYFASIEVDKVGMDFSTVEWESQSDTYECIGFGPWTHYKDLSSGPHIIPTVAIELRLLTELGRQRPDRYKPIIQFMKSNDFNKDLLTRGLQEQNLLSDENTELLKALSL